MKFLKKIVFVASIILAGGHTLFAQSDSEIELLKKHKATECCNDTVNKLIKPPANELQMVFHAFFKVYKTLVSSQDVSRCVFYPSCSVYTVLAIQNQGFLFGLLNSLDRLQRCNPLSPEKYIIDKKTELFIDFPND